MTVVLRRHPPTFLSLGVSSSHPPFFQTTSGARPCLPPFTLRTPLPPAPPPPIRAAVPFLGVWPDTTIVWVVSGGLLRGARLLRSCMRPAPGPWRWDSSGSGGVSVGRASRFVARRQEYPHSTCEQSSHADGLAFSFFFLFFFLFVFWFVNFFFGFIVLFCFFFFSFGYFSSFSFFPGICSVYLFFFFFFLMWRSFSFFCFGRFVFFGLGWCCAAQESGWAECASERGRVGHAGRPWRDPEAFASSDCGFARHAQTTVGCGS